MDEKVARLHFAAICFDNCGAFELAKFCRKLILEIKQQQTKGDECHEI